MAAPTPQVMVDGDIYKEGLDKCVGTYTGSTKVSIATVKSTIVVGPGDNGKYPLEMMITATMCFCIPVMNEKSVGAVEADKTITLKSKESTIKASISGYARDELSPTFSFTKEGKGAGETGTLVFQPKSSAIVLQQKTANGDMLINHAKQ